MPGPFPYCRACGSKPCDCDTQPRLPRPAPLRVPLPPLSPAARERITRAVVARTAELAPVEVAREPEGPGALVAAMRLIGLTFVLAVAFALGRACG